MRMKVENRGENFSENLYALDKIFANSYKPRTKVAQADLKIDNGYSSLPIKELNSNIGILQIALSSLERILNDDEITLASIKRQIHNAKFLGQNVYATSMIIKDSNGETLFDANRILGIIPNNESDLYMFKKMLKSEISFIQKSLSSLQDSTLLQNKAQDFSNAKDYLTSHSSLFAKAHNTASLHSKLDALLA